MQITQANDKEKCGRYPLFRASKTRDRKPLERGREREKERGRGRETSVGQSRLSLSGWLKDEGRV